MADLYVRTKQGVYRDDRHEFSSRWAKVPEELLGSVHFDNPNLEIRTEKTKEKEDS